MKKSDVLKRAKNFLWDGSKPRDKSKYICHAVEDACGWYCPGPYNQPLASIVKDFVREYLWLSHPVETLEEKISRENPHFPIHDASLMQALRHRKLDEMINYLEERGE